MQTGIAGDQFWQFGPANLSVDTAPFGDDFSIYINKPEFAQLGLQHAVNMTGKRVLKTSKRIT
jgi:mannan endo-1,4-beta-mannosidase